MSEPHGHSHAHEVHGHGDERRLGWALALTGAFMLAEIGGGLLAHSLALLADAGHMLSDTFSLALAFAALRFARRPADRHRSYGYRRMQVLAAFTNGLLLLGISLIILIEAAQRMFKPVEVMGTPMLVIASLGLVVNIGAFALLHSADQGNLNIRGAVLHVLGDLLGSVAAIAAAIIILLTGWMPADPLLSVLVAGMIIRGSFPIMREAAHILLEGTPRGFDPDEIAATVEAEIADVDDVHHVHIWALDPDRPLITMHVRLAPGADARRGLEDVQRVLEERYAIDHATVQIEDGACLDEHAHVSTQAAHAH
jgi:cobalt-zinc-cadmium efflux system protein